MGAPRGLGRPNCSGFPSPANSLLPPCCRVKHGQSFLMLFLSFLMLFFSSMFYLLFSISFFISPRSLLGSILNSQTDPPTLGNVDFTIGILTVLKHQRFRPKDGFESVLGLSRAPFGSSWGSLGSSLGPLDRPQRASRFVLELSWAWFARFLLPKMALGASWGCFWILGAPEGLLRLVLGAPEGLLRVEIGLTDANNLA